MTDEYMADGYMSDEDFIPIVGSVSYVDHMGSDTHIVNAARVSFNTRTEELRDKDIKLIKYLAEHNHWSPFAHTSICLHIKVPLFVARQLHKHQVGFVVNEVSRRYVKTEPEFYLPEYWRKAAPNVKQGSSNEVYSKGKYMNDVNWNVEYAGILYENLIKDGLCPEQARMFLPQNMYTEFWMTGSLVAWARLYTLRCDGNTQQETRGIAYRIYDTIDGIADFQHSWRALVDMVGGGDQDDE